jgi:hypothetical protein
VHRKRNPLANAARCFALLSVAFDHLHAHQYVAVSRRSQGFIRSPRRYHTLGRRIRATYYNRWGSIVDDTLYYYDGQRVVAEYDYDETAGTQTLARWFVDGPLYVDEHVMMHDATTDDKKRAVKALKEVHSVNRHVEKYLTGRKRMPKHLPGFHGFGDENGATVCADAVGRAWKRHPNAVEWLKRGG